ncbi:MAG: hypothetical protein MRY78_19880 [Saprospiraceae bacterium]|nr:hypothetical protein [Saprospiraceae bacterium]
MTKTTFLNWTCCLIFLCAFTTLSAQRNYQKATITLLNGDTLSGFIEEQGSLELSQSVKFRITEEEKSRTYLPTELRSFRFATSGMKYESIRINSALDTTYKQRLAEVMIEGDVKLYKLQLPDQEKTVINNLQNIVAYYIRKDNKIHRLELIEKQVTGSNNTGRSQTSNIEVREYVGVLKYLFSDCPAIYPKIDRLRFKDSAMESIVKDYAECTNQQVVEIDRIQPFKKKVEQSFGLAFLRPLGSTSNDYGFMAGYYREISSLQRSSFISFLFGAGYTFISTEREALNVLYKDNFHMLTIPAHVNFRFNNNSSWTPFLTIGTTLKFLEVNNFERMLFAPSFDLGGGVLYKNIKFTVTRRDDAPVPDSLLGSGANNSNSRFWAFELAYIFRKTKK